MQQMSLFSQEGSHNFVNPLQLQEKEKVQEMIAGSGKRLLELYENFLPHGSFLRMLTVCLLSKKEWYSSNCWLTWKTKVTPVRRLLFQLAPSTPRIGGIGCGLLRTPDAGMGRGPRSEEKLKDRYLKRKMPLCLNDQLAMIVKGLLPTPAARDYKGMNSLEHLKKKRGHHYQLPNAIGMKAGLKLHPDFVEWMQGFPPGWTDLER